MGTTLLAIDTAGPRLQLALLRGDGGVDTTVEDMPQGQAERLFPAIEELLSRNRLAYSDLDRVAVTTGPGSFTGVRIGLSAARGLGLALGIPVIGVGSLRAISLAAPDGAQVAVLLDARRNEAYFQLFSGPGAADGEPRLMAMELAPRSVPPKATLLTTPFPDVVALARFAQLADPRRHAPDPAYLRDADARPQERFRVAREVAS